MGVAKPVPLGSCFALSGGIARVAESGANASDIPQVFWSNSNCTGLGRVIMPGQEAPSLGFGAHSLSGSFQK